MTIEYPNTYFVFDLETTGLDPAKDEAVEIGVLKVVDGQPTLGLTLILKPSIPMSEEASRITGITNQMLEYALDPMDAWQQFVEFTELDQLVQFSPLVGHNISRFDNAFVDRAIKKLGFSMEHVKFYDTAAMYKAHKMGTPPLDGEDGAKFAHRILNVLRSSSASYKLVTAYTDLGGSMDNIRAHRTEGDVKMTQYVYNALRFNGGPHTHIQNV